MKPIFEPERQFIYKQTDILLPVDCWRNGTKIYLDFTCKKPIYTFKVIDQKMKITKNNTELFKDYKQKKINELIQLYDDRLNRLELKSVIKTIEYILSHSNYKFVIGHSGGKDSTVLYSIWTKALDILDIKYSNIIDWEINFSNTSNDTADTYKYIKNELPKDKLHILNPEIGFYQWIINVKNYFIPSIMVRNCCSTYKEGQINKHYNKKELITMVLGLRSSESSKRKNYDYVMDHDFVMKLFKTSNISKHWIRFAPIIEWNDEDIWLYILRDNLKYNNQYNMGFNRCGCLICPFQSDYIDIIIQENYPTQWKRWVNILTKNYELFGVESRLKWTLQEWIGGKWKQGTSVEQELIHKKPTIENIKKLCEVKNINEDVAIKYFNRKCDCGKKLNSDEIAINLKMYGRNMDLDELKCKKCFCKSNNMTGKEYVSKVHDFRDSGCNLF